MQEKKVFVTTDGKEFSSKKIATKHENKMKIAQKFFTEDSPQSVTDKAVTDFVTTMSQHVMGWKIEPAITLHWDKWDDREMDMFIRLADRIVAVGDTEMVTMKFIDNRGFSKGDVIASFTVEKPEDHTMDSLFKVLNEDQIKEIDIHQDFDEHGKRIIAIFNESDSSEEKYVYYIKSEMMPIAEKLNKGIMLSSSDLQELVFEHEVFEEEFGSGRWSTHKRTVVDVDGQLYAIDWEQGLTVATLKDR